MTRLSRSGSPRAYLLGLALAMAGCTHEGPTERGSVDARIGATANRCRASQPPYSRFELAVLGSGGPVAAGRAAASYAVFLDGKARILVDAGPGAFVRLGEMGIDLKALDTVLLTHLHIDHTGDLPGFVKSRDLSFDQPLLFRVFGPVGNEDFPTTTEFIGMLFGPRGAFRYLRTFRNDLRFAVVDLPAQPDAPVHEVLREDDLRVTSVAVDHDGAPAVAYRIEHAGRVLVMSGDLASENDNLARLAAGADLLVYDASVLDPPGSPEPLYELHTPPRRIGQVAAAARVKSVLLSHLTPSVERRQDEVLRSVHAAFAGEARMAEDCMRVDLTKQ